MKVIGWPLEVGGHIMSSYSLTKEMQHNGIEYILISPNGQFAYMFKGKAYKHVISKSLLKRIPFNLMLLPTLIKSANKYKVQLIHAMDFKSLYPCYLASSYLKIPLVFTVAGGRVPYRPIPKSCVVIVFSKELNNGMEIKYPELLKPIQLIKERIDTQLFTSAYPKNCHPGLPFKLIIAMRMEESKRPWLEYAMKEIENLSKEEIDFEFILAGDGPIKDELKRKASDINKLTHKNYFRFLGAVSDPKKMAEIYQTSDVVIGHGRGVLEGMACKKPAVVLGPGKGATLVEGKTVEKICEYNFSGRHILRYPETIKPLSKILLELHNDVTLRDQLSVFSRSYIEKEYDLETGAKKIVNIYAENRQNSKCDKTSFAIFWFLKAMLVRIFTSKWPLNS